MIESKNNKEAKLMDLGTYIFVGMVSLAIILGVGVISFIKKDK